MPANAKPISESVSSGEDDATSDKMSPAAKSVVFRHVNVALVAEAAKIMEANSAPFLRIEKATAAVAAVAATPLL